MRWARWWLIASCHGAEVVTVDDGPAVVTVDDAAVVVVVDERIIAVVVTEGALHLLRAHGAAVVSHLPEGQGSRSRPTCAASTSALSFFNSLSPVPVADGSWQPAPLPLPRSASLAPAAFGWPRRRPGASSRSFPLALAAFASQSRWFAYAIVADGICRARHGREPEVRSIYM